jgi:hypothetical protein
MKRAVEVRVCVGETNNCGNTDRPVEHKTGYSSFKSKRSNKKLLYWMRMKVVCVQQGVLCVYNKVCCVYKRCVVWVH